MSSDLVTGLVAVGIRPSLPFKGVHLLLGNGLAGDKFVVNPFLTVIPCIDQPPDPIEQIIPDLYPPCAVIRAMAKEAKQNDGDIDLTDTFWSHSFQHKITNSLSSSLWQADRLVTSQIPVITIQNQMTKVKVILVSISPLHGTA